MAKKIGAVVSVYNFPVDVTNKQVLESMHFLQTKGDIHGIIVQLPLPPHSKLDADKLLQAIDPEKDVDGFHPQSPFMVPIAAAVLHLLEYVYEQDPKAGRDLPSRSKQFRNWLKEKQIVVIGKGKTGGQPVIDLLYKLKLAPQIIDSKMKHPEQIIEKADIIISAVGKREVIKKDMLKKDVILIGIGMHKGEDGKFYGDYEEEDIKNIASFYTPIPGGVGPVNVAKLMENLVMAAENQYNVKNGRHFGVLH